jgi:hypothetical protein
MIKNDVSAKTVSFICYLKNSSVFWDTRLLAREDKKRLYCAKVLSFLALAS